MTLEPRGVKSFYALTCKVGGSHRLASSSILLATAYPYALFTAELRRRRTSTCFTPLHPSFPRLRKVEGGLLLTAASSALVMAHHLAALVALAVLEDVELPLALTEVGRREGAQASGILRSGGPSEDFKIR